MPRPPPPKDTTDGRHPTRQFWREEVPVNLLAVAFALGIVALVVFR